ncbi:hypothetical protein CVT26_012441 [Gymnopilus dilepis]|uniref:XPG-I domain-containing protein n=1 Tax=Gymnopilus dilepis TaxID=231916 RepID=A0A409YWA3_9AGAR|nr:hypothetical protein CVT26_012441 [Gymnopilus dilepis]
MSLIEIAVREGFEIRRHGTGQIVIGVDVSPLFYASQAVFNNRSHANAGQNPELRALFFRLTWLSRSGAIVVLVFDGPGRPGEKRNRHVRTIPHWLTRLFKELALAFGFYCHTAPGEAEAELAYLNSVQAVDIVYTADSDIFVFGATQIMRSVPDSQNHDNVEIYTADMLSRQSDGALYSPAGFLLYAILNGGDYDPAGFPGCGSVLASALASGPLAAPLFSAVLSRTRDDLLVFLKEWRADLQDELANNRSGKLGRKYPALAARLPENFPDPDVLRLYCFPVTSRSNGGVPASASTWLLPRVPDTARLASLCERHFGWRQNLVPRFISNVWDGHLIRHLMKLAILNSADPNAPVIRSISRASKKITSPSAFPSYRVNISMPSLVSDAVSAISDPDDNSNQIRGVSTLTTMAVWVPEPIMRAVANAVVAKYESSHPNVTFPVPSNYFPVLEEDFEVMASF